MSDPNPTLLVLAAFVDELAKEAAVADVARRALSRGVLHGVGAGAGGGLGLGIGAGALAGGTLSGVQRYRQAREQGNSLVSSLGSAAGGAARGALLGGAVGGVAGTGLGAVAGGVAPTKVISATKNLAKRQDSVGSFSRFGQRQVHSLTGWKPGGATSSIESIGAGAAPARAATEQSLEKLKSSPEMDGVVKAVASGDRRASDVAREALRKGPQAELTGTLKRLQASEATQRMGLTSLPGYAKSIQREGLVPTVRAGVKEQWQASGPKGKAMMVGFPALYAAQTLKRPEGSEQGRGETIGKMVGGTLGSMAAPTPLAGSLALGAGFERAGGLVGRGVDRLRGRRPGQAQRPQVPQEPSRPPATEPGDTGQAAVERVYGTGYGGGAGGLE